MLNPIVARKELNVLCRLSHVLLLYLFNKKREKKSLFQAKTVLCKAWANSVANSVDPINVINIP